MTMADADSGAGGYQHQREQQAMDREATGDGDAFPSSKSIAAHGNGSTGSGAKRAALRLTKPNDAAPPPADNPENPKEFTKLISGISSMQETLKSKDDTIRQLQMELDRMAIRQLQLELDKFTNERKIDELSKNIATVEQQQRPKAISADKQQVKGLTAKSATKGQSAARGKKHAKKSPTKTKKTAKSPIKTNKTESQKYDQKASVEAFMEKVRRRESTTEDWARLVKIMQSSQEENRNNFRKKLDVALKSKAAPKQKKGWRKLVEMQMVQMAIKVVVVAVVILAAMLMLGDSGGESTGVAEISPTEPLQEVQDASLFDAKGLDSYQAAVVGAIGDFMCEEDAAKQSETTGAINVVVEHTEDVGEQDDDRVVEIINGIVAANKGDGVEKTTLEAVSDLHGMEGSIYKVAQKSGDS